MSFHNAAHVYGGPVIKAMNLPDAQTRTFIKAPVWVGTFFFSFDTCPNLSDPQSPESYL